MKKKIKDLTISDLSSLKPKYLLSCPPFIYFLRDSDDRDTPDIFIKKYGDEEVEIDE